MSFLLAGLGWLTNSFFNLSVSFGERMNEPFFVFLLPLKCLRLNVSCQWAELRETYETAEKRLLSPASSERPGVTQLVFKHRN